MRSLKKSKKRPKSMLKAINLIPINQVQKMLTKVITQSNQVIMKTTQTQKQKSKALFQVQKKKLMSLNSQQNNEMILTSSSILSKIQIKAKNQQEVNFGRKMRSMQSHSQILKPTTTLMSLAGEGNQNSRK